MKYKNLEDFLWVHVEKIILPELSSSLLLPKENRLKFATVLFYY